MTGLEELFFLSMIFVKNMKEPMSRSNWEVGYATVNGQNNYA
jgi:hypothetical protein